ncbi:MAG: 16S rRNA (adenine(1518)-N(6)/adenine(1519)-N(6))-dimethyltransferase RsmA [Xanthomonadales bacterium]|nr:16S rRNA (adenine(1518)-N(6)/adenine(1519)-N(6))-dimethyltransferase RsmA [Xanthomonadales bacterium]
MKHQARKRFGQNFLVDQQVISRIVSTIDPQPGQLLVEIGPGQAALTKPLLETGTELHLVEIDRDLAEVLRQRLLLYPNGHLHIADALRLNFAELSGGRPFRLIGNLPYNISTPLLFHVLQWQAQIIDMHFMLQKELVDRMCSSPGSKAWGRLAIMCQYHCEVVRMFDVPPTAFSPSPKVQSSIVRLVPHATPPVALADMKQFQQLLTQVFNHRRKTLRNCLQGWLEVEQIESLGIDPGLRPEMLDLATFAALSRMMEQTNAD